MEKTKNTILSFTVVRLKEDGRYYGSTQPGDYDPDELVFVHCLPGDPSSREDIIRLKVEAQKIARRRGIRFINNLDRDPD